jgi:hypothetical protein
MSRKSRRKGEDCERKCGGEAGEAGLRELRQIHEFSERIGVYWFVRSCAAGDR